MGAVDQLSTRLYERSRSRARGERLGTCLGRSGPAFLAPLGCWWLLLTESQPSRGRHQKDDSELIGRWKFWRGRISRNRGVLRALHTQFGHPKNCKGVRAKGWERLDLMW
jgi:hypothetical protein